MPTFEEIKTFNGGLNKDDDPRYLPQGDYIDALNLTSNISEGTAGVLTSISGNTEIDMYLSVDGQATISSIDTGTETITTSSAHGYLTGVALYYDSFDGPTIGGLTKGTIYYAIKVNNTKLQLATTEANAIAGTAINLTSTPVGTHTLTLRFALPVGTNTVIGCANDFRNNHVYYLVHNSNNRHSILRYSETDNKARLVAQDNSWFVGFSPWYSLYDSTPWDVSTSYDMLTIVSHNSSYYVSLQDGNEGIDPEGASNTQITPLYSELYWKKIDNYLNFSAATDKITGIETFDYDGDTYLVWTDGSEEIKMLNVDRAMAYGAANRYAPMEPEYANLYAYTPQYVIKADYKNDSNVDNNTVARKLFQFRYRWKYRNGEVSVMSPISKIPLPTQNVASGFLTTDNNKIRLKVPVRDNYNNATTNTGWKSEVESVEVFFRENGDRNIGSWYQVATLRVDEETISSPAVTKTISALDTVTEEVTVTAHGLATGEPVLYTHDGGGSPIGGLSSGTVYYVGLVTDVDRITLSTSIRNALAGTSINLSGTLGGTNTLNTFYDAQDAPFYIEYDFFENSDSIAVDTLESGQLYDFLPHRAPTLSLSSSNRLNIGAGTHGRDFDESTLDISVALNPSAVENSMAVSGFKSGSYHKFGIVYADAQGRLSNIYTNNDCLFYVPYPNSTNRDSNWLQISIGHAPPSWAEYYHIVWSGNQSKSSYIQFIGSAASTPAGATNLREVTIKSVSDLDGEADTANVNYNYTFTEGDIIVPIKNASGTYYRDIPTLNEVDYSQVLKYASGVVTFDVDGWKTFGANGDMYEIYSPAAVDESAVWHEIGDAYRIGYDTGGNRVHNAYNGASNSQNQKIAATAQDAIVVAQAGDCYMFGIGQWIDNPTTPYPSYSGIEAQYVSPLYGPKASSIGRPNTKSESQAEVTYETQIDYTEPFIDNTNFFGVSRSYDTNFVDNLNQSYGSIQLLRSYGDTLICIQKTRTSSLLANKYFINTADLSSPSVGQTQNALSEPRYLIGEYGTDSPESFAQYGNFMFWVDKNSGAIIRCNGSSLENIAQAKMSSYFEYNLSGAEAKTLASISEENSKVYGAYSVNDSEYIVSLTTFDITQATVANVSSYNYRFTFTDEDVERGLVSNIVAAGIFYIRISNTDNYSLLKATVTASTSTTVDADITTQSGDDYPLKSSAQKVILPVDTTIAFNNARSRWTSRYSFTPQYMGRTSVGLVSFSGGRMYLHSIEPYYDSTDLINKANWNRFYGTVYDSEVEFSSNENPQLVKRLLSINVESNQSWSMPFAMNFSSDTPTTERTQITELEASDFELYEGQWWSNFLMNKYTPNLTYPLLDGEGMRGSYHVIKLSTSIQDGTSTFIAPAPILFSSTIVQLYSAIS